MREFLLVVPDLMPAAGALRAPPAAAVAAGLRFGPATSLPDGWRGALAARLGRADLDGLPVAAVVAAALQPQQWPGEPVAPGSAWLATPLHLVAGLDTLHLPQDGILALEPGELSELAESFARDLGGGRLLLRPATADAFVLLGLDLPAASTVEPLACLGADLSRAQAAGPGAGGLRRLMSEIEMWLHEHPLNRRRAATGQPPVRALWLWGGGAARSSAPAPAVTATRVAPVGAATPPRRVFSDDAWVRAACRLARVELAPPGGMPDAADFGAPGDVVATARLHASDVPDVEAFERRHLQPAFEALAAGRLQRLTVLAADRQLTLTASDRFRLWRPRRAWLAALGARG